MQSFDQSEQSSPSNGSAWAPGTWSESTSIPWARPVDDGPKESFEGEFRSDIPALAGRTPGRPMASLKHHQRRLISVEEAAAATRSHSPEQRMLILDAWLRSGLPAGDFAPIAGVSKHTLYAWKKRFAELGPAGLVDGATTRGPSGSKLPPATRRAIVMLKRANPGWGCQRISDVMYRGPGLAASESAVARVLKEEGYVLEESPTRPNPGVPREFERATANQLWQTDLFTFMLKRQNRRMYLVAFMDDHSRYIVGYGLHASQSAALVLEVFRAAINSCGAPQEVLTDNGAQYVTWRGTSKFAHELATRGIRHLKASPHRSQTLGKVERFWGTMWRECIEPAIFLDLEDARRRIGLFIDHYNFQRPHQGLSKSEGVAGLAPADRYFGAVPQTLESMRSRVAANSLALAQNGILREPFYISGQVGGKPFSVHAEGERVILIAEDGVRREVDLTRPDVPPEVREAAARAEESERVVHLLDTAFRPDRPVCLPYRVRWWGFGGNVAVCAAGTWLVVATMQTMVRQAIGWHRHRRSWCMRCGYPKEQVHARCSECGAGGSPQREQLSRSVTAACGGSGGDRSRLPGEQREGCGAAQAASNARESSEVTSPMSVGCAAEAARE